MLKVLLVDDKYIVRKCLRQCIPWQENDFVIIGEADGGKAALEMCKNLNPDIIITDICMPSVDGLKLIKMVREFDSNVEFLILSGYDKFEYARTAMHLGVTAYLLKPIKNEELLSEMLRLKKKIFSKRELSDNDENSEQLKRELFLLEYINAPVFLDSEQFSNLMTKYGFQRPNLPYFTVNISLINSNEANKSYHLRYMQTLLYKLLNKFELFLCQLDKQSLLALIFANSDKKENIIKMINSLKKTVSFEFAVGSSELCDDIGKFSLQKDSAVKAAASSGLNSSLPSDEKITAPSLSASDIKLVIAACRNNKLDEAANIYISYFAMLKALPNVDFDTVKSRVKALILSLAYSFSDDIGELSEFLKNAESGELMQLNTLDEVRQWCINITYELIRQCNQYSVNVEKIISYIHLHYSEQITLNAVAEHFFFSPQHLLRLLKKETNKTFTNYLTEYRISKADELLKTGRYKIYEICEMVGYHDSAYFGKLYKKITGKNPSHYISSRERFENKKDGV